MKLPIAVVTAVLIWSSSKYLPTYFIEMRKMDMLEQKIQFDAARQLAVLKQVKAQNEAQARAAGESAALEKRFY
jgi:hypothetical protein